MENQVLNNPIMAWLMDLKYGPGWRERGQVRQEPQQRIDSQNALRPGMIQNVMAAKQLRDEMSKQGY